MGKSDDVRRWPRVGVAAAPFRRSDWAVPLRRVADTQLVLLTPVSGPRFDESGHGWARIASSLSFSYAERECSRTIDTWDEFILLYLWKQNPPRWPPCCEFKCLREKLLSARNRRFGTYFMVTESSAVHFMSRSLFKHKNENVLLCNFTSFCLTDMNHFWLDTCYVENYYVKVVSVFWDSISFKFLFITL